MQTQKITWACGACFCRKGAVSAIVGMPALERLALPRTEEHDRDPAFAEVRQLVSQ